MGRGVNGRNSLIRGRVCGPHDSHCRAAVATPPFPRPRARPALYGDDQADERAARRFAPPRRQIAMALAGCEHFLRSVTVSFLDLAGDWDRRGEAGIAVAEPKMQWRGEPMAEAGDHDASAVLARSPERPINSPAEDKLQRGGFIARLTNAVIDLSTRKATAVVVGITGPWGERQVIDLKSPERSHKSELPGGYCSSL